MKIEGKTFVVTGGASGLGEGTTRETGADEREERRSRQKQIRL